MRVVVRPAKPGTYPPTDRLAFAGANVTAITLFKAPVSGTATFLIVDLLDIVLGKVKGVALVPPQTSAALDKAVSAIANRVPDVYKLAAVPLIQGIGAFCSYCGTPLPGLAEVEHCVPKAPYPTYAVDWDNFLVACSPCNTCKSNDPTRVIATGWTGKANPTEAELYGKIRNFHYLWPDLDPGAFGELEIGLQYLNTATNTWTNLSSAASMDTNNFMVSQNIATREVRAMINLPGTGMSNVAVQAFVLSGSAHATEMIGLCGLNVCTTPASTYDRRVFNRTIAWFTALLAIKHYKTVIGTPQAPTFATMIKMLSVGIGFYEVWLNLLADTLSPADAKSFATDLNVQGQYPGSNVAAMFP